MRVTSAPSLEAAVLRSQSLDRNVIPAMYTSWFRFSFSSDGLRAVAQVGSRGFGQAASALPSAGAAGQSTTDLSKWVQANVKSFRQNTAIIAGAR